MSVEELIKYLPLGEKFKSFIMDFVIPSAVVLYNSYSPSVFSYFIAFVTCFIVLFRLLKIAMEAKEAYYKQETARMLKEKTERHEIK